MQIPVGSTQSGNHVPSNGERCHDILVDKSPIALFRWVTGLELTEVALPISVVTIPPCINNGVTTIATQLACVEFIGHDDNEIPCQSLSQPLDGHNGCDDKKFEIWTLKEIAGK